MIKVNNQEITQVFANSTEIHAVLVDGEVVFLDKHTLSITQTEGFVINVELYYSPFTDAETEVFLNSGDNIYWNDRLIITVEENGNDANTVVDSLVVSGNSFNSTSKVLDVAGDISISITTRQKQWHQINTEVIETPHHTTTTLGIYAVDIPNLNSDYPVKFSAGLYTEASANPVYSVYDYILLDNNQRMVYSYKNKTQEIGPYYDESLQIGLTRAYPTFFYKPIYWKITKIEQFF